MLQLCLTAVLHSWRSCSLLKMRICQRCVCGVGGGDEIIQWFMGHGYILGFRLPDQSDKEITFNISKCDCLNGYFSFSVDPYRCCCLCCRLLFTWICCLKEYKVEDCCKVSLLAGAAVMSVACLLRTLMLIGADVGAVPWELFCLGFRQLTCWRDCLTFSGSLRPSSLI